MGVWLPEQIGFFSPREGIKLMRQTATCNKLCGLDWREKKSQTTGELRDSKSSCCQKPCLTEWDTTLTRGLDMSKIVLNPCSHGGSPAWQFLFINDGVKEKQIFQRSTALIYSARTTSVTVCLFVYQLIGDRLFTSCPSNVHTYAHWPWPTEAVSPLNASS